MAMSCLRCGGTPELGVLCRPCAIEVAPSDGLVPDHIRSTVDPADAEAWVVDGFGGAHAIGEKSVLRVRGVLAEVGTGGILSVAPGRGYYLSCTVTTTRTSSPADPGGHTGPRA